MNKQVLLLFLILLFSAIGYSLIAPLYPTLGEHRHINEEILGWIISIYALFNFFITPFVPYIAAKFGRKTVFYIATLAEALCTFLYGLLYYIHSKALLIGLSFLGRIIHGLGSGVTGTLVYSLASTVSEPSELKMSLGFLEIAWSLGVAIGPLIGSFFYHIGGFPLPFYVLGASLFVSVYLIHYLSLPISNEQEESPSFVKGLFNLHVILNLLPVVINLLSNTYYFPSLTNHLTHKWGLSVEISSIFFVLNMLVYFITLQFLDIMTNKFGLIFTIWIGLIFIVLGPLFVYPMEFLPQCLLSIIFGLALLGASGATINVPCLMELGRILKENDSTLDEFTANDISSAMYNFGVNIGDFTGPVFGGAISEKYGFKYSCLYMSFIGIAYAVIFGLFYFKAMYNDLTTVAVKQEPLIDDDEDYLSAVTDKKFRMNIPGHRKHTSHSSVHRIESQHNSKNISFGEI